MITMLFNAFNIIGSEWVMWLLMILSVMSIAVTLERFRNLRSQERVGALLWKEEIENWMKTGNIQEEKVPGLVRRYPCVEAELLEVMIAAQPTAEKDLEHLMTSFIGRKKIELDKNLIFLGTLGSNTPFIGLFGTVLGIIKAFHDIGAKPTEGGAESISLGLSEALVATAVGLVVAIPAIIAFNFFQRKIKMIVARAESLGNYVMSFKHPVFQDERK